ncbi:DUF3307 domain-containing protein [Kitasatospora griseola]|uniref:DUF3307 domain-containing protein n=1 Tax=Kitasatospora griseola TaxID=2064 RepID=UPI0036596C0F
MFPHSAAVFAAAFLLLLVSHYIGDYLIQTDHMAEHKADAGRDGWRANGQHVLGHLGAMLGLFAVADLALGLATPAWPTVAAIAWVAGTHGIIDRRRIIAWWMQHTGSGEFLKKGGAPLVDQAAHVAVGLFPAAVLIGAAA